MKKTVTKIAIAAIAAASLMAGCKNGGGSGGGGTAHYQTIQIPTDVAQTCTVDSTQFNSWFASGTAAANGVVAPANSVTFPLNASDSNFYKWSEQMFLWITSKTPDNSIVLENKAFFMVLPDSADGNREMVQCEPGNLQTVAHIKNFIGHDNRIFVQDKKGKIWKVLPAEKKAAEQAMIASDNGLVKAVRVEANAAGGHKFFDEKGKEILHPHAVIAGKTPGHNVAKQVIVGGKTVLFSANGEVDAETAQASGNALIAQNNSIVYYILFVNDFYAYYATGQKKGVFKGTKIDSLFPTDAAGRDLVCKYARDSFHATINDSNALAMELKTSWVEVNDQLLDKDSFITVKATVPHFDHINDSLWIQNPAKATKTKLALIGMHIVGSANGHPEMIWATFEHGTNAPNYPYIYKTTSNTLSLHPADACGGKWLLDDTTCQNENQNGLTASRSNGVDSIKGTAQYKIGPRNVRRQAPWGNFDTSSSDLNTIAQNTMVMSLNNSVRGQINALGKDIRTQYLMIGALWTTNGVVPNPDGLDSFQVPIDTINARGGIQLANATMETYMTAVNIDAGCFDCHNGSLNPAAADELSHIFSDLNPLKNKGLPKTPDAIKNADAAKKPGK